MSDSILNEVRRVLDVEISAMQALLARIDESFVRAVQLILSCEGKLIVTGIGKSGQIGRKIASTFSSTGTPAIFLHPAESSHGDLGVVSEKDLVIGISNGGESQEMLPILRYVQRKGIPFIAITGKADSSLGQAAAVIIDSSVEEEACPLGLAPTSSSTVTLAIGDAIAMSVLKERGFNESDYAEFHPGGKLGRRLLTRVDEVMHKGDALPVVLESEEMTKVISLMTAKEVRGVAGVVDKANNLIGAITDGDIRRRLEKNGSLEGIAKDLMTKHPKTIDCNELAVKALFLMEQFRIQTLFTVDKSADNPQQVVGILHIQDLLKANIK